MDTQIPNPQASDVGMQLMANESQAAATSTPSNSVVPMVQDQNESIKAELERSLKVILFLLEDPFKLFIIFSYRP